MNWMNLPGEYSTTDAKFVILPIAYEKNLTYGAGASKGAHEIVKASSHLEYYDDQFDCEAFLEGIRLLPSLELSHLTPEQMVENIASTVRKQENNDKFLISLGGDHSVTIGTIKGLEQLYENESFSVIQFDAHADMRDSWNGSSLNHACTARQISKNHDLVLVGVRSMDIDEKKLIDSCDNVHLISSYDYSLEKLRTVLPLLKQKVFITIDVDVFDPSFLRNTGTPEPGGLSWNQIINALKLIFAEKQVIGADIVEFAPNNDFGGEAYFLAKLAYKLMNLAITKKESL